jgi:predicted PurR-regulated permease PerM
MPNGRGEDRPSYAAADETPREEVTEASQPAPVHMEQIERRRLSRLSATSDALIATAVIIGVCWWAKLPLVVLCVSILLAFILAPLVELFQRLRLPRALASAIAVVALLAVLYGIFYVSYNRARQFATEWPKYSGEVRSIANHIRLKAERIQRTTEGVLPGNDGPAPHTVQVQQRTTWTELVTQNLGSVTEVVLMVSFIPFLVYFMLTWQEHVRASTVMLFRIDNRNTAYVALGMITSMIRSFIVGNVLVGLFISGVSVAVFGLAGVPYFYFIGFISGFLSLVPYLGPVLALFPPVIAGLGHIHSTQYAIVIVTVFASHLFAINVLFPKFIGSRLNLNPLAVTLALLFWGWLWGAMGLILAIPITAALKIILDHVESMRPYAAWMGE